MSSQQFLEAWGGRIVKILVVASLFPVPADNGSAVRAAGVLAAMAGRHEVLLLVNERPGMLRTGLRSLESTWGVRGELFRSDTNRARIHLRAARDNIPPWVAAIYSRNMRARILSESTRHNLIFVLEDYASYHLFGLPLKTPILMDKHHVFGAAGSQASATSLGSRARATIYRRRAIAFESRALELGPCIVTSSAEQSRLRRIYGRSALRVIPSAIDLPKGDRACEPRTVLILGNYHYAPNAEGLRAFLNQSWPALRARHCRLLVTGGIPDTLRREVLRDGGEALGYVNDLDAVLAMSTVGVAPVWSGAGVKIKTLTMLGAALPLVATPAALEGVKVQPGVHCLIADTPAAIPSKVLALMTNREAAAKMGRAGRALIREQHSWGSASTALLQTIADSAR